jgi:hypothetical protein
MPHDVSRWALLASLALHAAAFTLTFGRSPRTAIVQAATLPDFWAGNTFEVPEHLGDLAFASAASEESKKSNEINTEGIDTSSSTRGGSERASTVKLSASPPPNPDGRDPGTPTAASPRGKARGAGHARDPRALASANPSAGSSGSTGSASSGTFGAEGAAAGVRDLVRFFVRTMPIVASSDPVWGTLPLGAAGATEVTLGLDGAGKPFAAEPPESAAPAHLRRLIHKTLSVMSSGRFAPPPSDLPAAEQKLKIAIALTQQEPPGGDVGSGGAFSLRFEPADAHHVSRAFFTLATGRRVEVSVRQLSVR